MALMNGSHTFRKDHIFFGNLCDVFPANNKLLVKLQKLNETVLAKTVEKTCFTEARLLQGVFTKFCFRNLAAIEKDTTRPKMAEAVN